MWLAYFVANYIIYINYKISHFAGQHKLYGYSDPYYKKYEISEIIVHPEYQNLYKYDIAVLKTKEDIE